MPKVTMMDRLAEAMKTLDKREGKALTPRQRVAAAQRWNSLADIGEDEVARLEQFADRVHNHGPAQSRYVNADQQMQDLGLTGPDGFRADNPFLSDIIDKYQEQSEFLDWCRYNRVEPNGQTLKQYRWETYKTLPYRQQQWIANKDAVRDYLDGMYGYDREELERINMLDELDDYLQTRHPEDNWPSPYDMQDSEVFESMDEFPDDFDYMWRY